MSAIVGIAADEDDDANEAQKVEPRKPAIPPPSPAAAALIDAGEPRELPIGDPPDWVTFGQRMIAVASSEEWPDWEEKNRSNMDRMQQESAKVYVRMASAIKKATDAHSRPGG